MEIKCEDCRKVAVRQVKNGEMCLGMPNHPSPPCDKFRICFIEKGRIYRDIWLSPVEVIGFKRLLDDLYDQIAEMALVMMEEDEG